MSTKARPRGLWWGEEAASGRVLAVVFGRGAHAPFRRLRAVLARLGPAVTHWFTDA